MGLTGFDSGQKRYVSMPGIEFKPVNPKLKQIIGADNFALAA